MLSVNRRAVNPSVFGIATTISLSLSLSLFLCDGALKSAELVSWCNSPRYISSRTNAQHVLCRILIGMTLASHIPQYHRLLTAGSSLGLSLPSVLMMTPVAQGQTATMYYLFKSASDMRYGVPIMTPPSQRDWLNLTQILTQWICSLFLYVILL